MYNDTLIGKTLSDAKKILNDMGIFDIHIDEIIGTKNTENLDTTLVIRADVFDNCATLVVSKFCLEI